MKRKKPPAVLETRGQAKTILARIRPAFRKHVRPHTRNRQGERLGGGSILNARGTTVTCRYRMTTPMLCAQKV